MCCERGQSTVEWTGLVLLVAVALGALVAVAPAIDGRSFGSYLANSIVCAVRGGCARADEALVRAYGRADAALLRRFAPNIVYEPGTDSLPVDFRRCRSPSCSDAPDDPDLDAAHSSLGGVPAAVFTHLLRRGGETFLQYWFYYPDSNTYLGPSAVIWNNSPAAWFGRYPGYHRDDWEGYFVRIDAGGRASVRASSHHGYQGCKQERCHNQWVPWTGWTRVSKGSHAGHIPMDLESRWSISVGREGVDVRELTDYRPVYPGRDVRERTTGAARLELIPVETLPPEILSGSRFDGISPPWRKEVYLDPLSDSTS
jgi:hypothetical protein